MGAAETIAGAITKLDRLRALTPSDVSETWEEAYRELSEALYSAESQLLAAPTVPHSLTVAQGDERAAFEADYAKAWNAAYDNKTNHTAADVAQLRDGDGYGDDVDYLKGRWEGWMARAAKPEQQGGGDAERQKALGEAVERACRELPADYEIQIRLENGYGGAKLYQFDGGVSTDLDDDDERDLAREISEGIATAIAQRAAAQGANDE
ncbi:hypothetical protein CEY04_23185 [Achromobacter sp. HZ28]|nr:hypothetical protein CEY05_24350 [Achromobacter sp. HZ34]OWT74221.1 hypothetical protein CEY04_23185 [Achromobacter sp. HZ28]